MRRPLTLVPVAVAAVLLGSPQGARADSGPVAAALINAASNYLLAAFQADPITDITIAEAFPFAQNAQQAASLALATAGATSRGYWSLASQNARVCCVLSLQDFQANPRNVAAWYSAIYWYYASAYASLASMGR
jgi:hypothetical protein